MGLTRSFDHVVTPHEKLKENKHNSYKKMCQKSIVAQGRRPRATIAFWHIWTNPIVAQGRCGQWTWPLYRFVLPYDKFCYGSFTFSWVKKNRIVLSLKTHANLFNIYCIMNRECKQEGTSVWIRICWVGVIVNFVDTILYFVVLFTVITTSVIYHALWPLNYKLVK